jgi:hypothetical protein
MTKRRRLTLGQEEIRKVVADAFKVEQEKRDAEHDEIVRRLIENLDRFEGGGLNGAG